MTIDEAIKHTKRIAREERFKANFERKFDTGCVKCAEEHEQLAEWLEELKEYKELEEKDLLVKLPCEYGTIVYVVGTRCLAGEEPDKGCDSVDCEECIYNKTYIIFERKVDNSLMCNLIIKDYSPFAMNDNVFLTREAAEEALKRLERLNEQRE